MRSPKLAQDIMVTRLATVNADADVFDAIKMLVKRRITGAPVVDAAQHFLGVFSEKCCMSVLWLVARLAGERGGVSLRPLPAREFMVTNLVTLSPHTDVYDAIGYLLRHRISGAPVVDAAGRFLGIFSEKTSMSVLSAAAYDQMPTAEVGAFMNTDFGRTISEDTDLLRCARMFLETPYRRLPVLRDGRLVGQISRRDVLVNENILRQVVGECRAELLSESGCIDRSDGAAEPAHGPLPSTRVGDFMDCHARTIVASTDLLSIVQIFLNTPYRRLPAVPPPARSAGRPARRPDQPTRRAAGDSQSDRRDAAGRDGAAVSEFAV